MTYLYDELSRHSALSHAPPHKNYNDYIRTLILVS